MAGECRFGSFGVTLAAWPSSDSPDTRVPDDLRRLVAEFDLGGVIYFARNIVEPAQVAELSREVAALARDWPFWISVDQEGGRVARLKAPFTEWPPAMTLGRSGDEALAARFATALAAELRAVGINLDYAPVLDVHTNPGQSRHRRSRAGGRGRATSRGSAPPIDSRAAGGAASPRAANTFPVTATRASTRTRRCRSSSTIARRLDAVELVPFRRAIADGVATIMTAHVLVPALDERTPASFSPRDRHRLAQGRRWASTAS